MEQHDITWNVLTCTEISYWNPPQWPDTSWNMYWNMLECHIIIWILLLKHPGMTWSVLGCMKELLLNLQEPPGMTWNVLKNVLESSRMAWYN